MFAGGMRTTAGSAVPQARAYTELEAEQVRQVLAESGYPHASRADVELVLRHVRLYETGEQTHDDDDGGGGNEPVTRHSAAAPSHTQQQQQQQQQQPPLLSSRAQSSASGGRSARDDSRSQPSLTWRSARRRAVPLAWDATTTTTHTAPPRVSSYAHEQQQQQAARHHRRPQSSTSSSSDDDDAVETTVRPHAVAQRQPQPQPSSSLLRHSRRDANVLFDITGDSRYRFRPATAVDAPREAIVPTPPARAHDGVYNARAAERHRGLALSRYSVAHLTANGSTLPHRADPVRRGAAMRALWQRDDFLAQRGRRAEVWRTRQAMMQTPTPHATRCDDEAAAALA